MDPVLLLMQPEPEVAPPPPSTTGIDPKVWFFFDDTPIPGDSAPNLFQGIHDRIDREASLNDLLPGGHYTGEADENRPDGTYIVLTLLNENEIKTTGITYICETNIQVSIFGGGDEALWYAKEAFRGVFNFRTMKQDPILVDDGNVFFIATRVGPRLSEKMLSYPGEPVIQQVIEMTTKQNKDYPS